MNNNITNKLIELFEDEQLVMALEIEHFDTILTMDRMGYTPIEIAEAIKAEEDFKQQDLSPYGEVSYMIH